MTEKMDNPFSKKPSVARAVGLSLTQEQYDVVVALAKELGSTNSGVFKMAMADFIDRHNRRQSSNG